MLTVLSWGASAQSLTISTAGQTGTSGTNWAVTGSNPVTLTYTGTANVAPSVLQGYLNAGTSVVVEDGGTGGDIWINDDLTKSAGGNATLTFRAKGGVFPSGTTDIVSTSGALNLVFWSEIDGGGVRGAFISNTTTNGGHFWVGGGSGSTTWNGLTVGTGLAMTDGLLGSFWIPVAFQGNVSTSGGDLYFAADDGGGPDPAIGALYSANQTVNAGSGNITFVTRDPIDWEYNNLGKLIVQTTGILSIAPPSGENWPAALAWTGTTTSNTFVGSSHLIGLQINNMNTLGGLNVGTTGAAGYTASNTQALTLSSALSLAGPVTFLGGNTTLSEGISISGSGADVLLSSTGWITLAANKSIATNAGDITFLATSGGTAITSGDAAIQLGSGASLNSSGGNISLRGAVTGADGALYAATNVTFGKPGILLTSNTISAAGGNISIYGKCSSSRDDGILISASTITTTGSGTVTVVGEAHGGYNGSIYFGGLSFANNSSTLSTVDGDLVLKGSLTAATNSAGAFPGGVNFYRVSGPGSTTVKISLLSRTGDVRVTGVEAAASVASSYGIVQCSQGDVYVGSPSDNSWTGTGDIIMTFTDIGYAGIDFIQAKTSGAVRWVPVGASFTDAFTLPAQYKLAVGASSLTLGSTTNTADLYVRDPLSIAGPIRMYGGIINSYEHIVSTTASDIELLGVSGFKSANTTRKEITTNGGNIFIDADSDANGTGVMSVDYLTFNPGAGNTLLQSSTVDWSTAASAIPFINGTGDFTFQNSAANFGHDWMSLIWFLIDQDNNGVGSITLGKSNNTSDVYQNHSTSLVLNGNLVMNGAAAYLSTATTANSGSVTVNATGNVSITGALAANNVYLTSNGAVTQSAAITATGLNLGGTGTFTLSNTSNNVGTLAGGTSGTKLGNVNFVNSVGFTVGTVTQSGIQSSGTVLLESTSGNITLAQSIATTNVGTAAVTLNAGKSMALGNALGGNILLSGTPSITTGTNGIVRLFSGREAESTGLTAFVGGTNNVRNGVDEGTSTFSPVLANGNKYALYRYSTSLLGGVTVVASGGSALSTNLWEYANNTILPTSATAVSINASEVEGYLNSNPLTIQAGSLTVSGALSSSSSNAFTVLVNNGLTVSNAVSLGGPISWTAGGQVNLSGNVTSNGASDVFIKSGSSTNPSLFLNTGAAFLKTGGAGTLTLQAQGRVQISGNVTATGLGVLNLVAWSDFDNSNNDGGVSIFAPISTNGGHVWLGGSSTNGGSYTWNGLAVGDGPSVGTAGNNANALDLYTAVTTNGGDFLAWAGPGYNTGTDGLANNNAGSVNAGSGDVTIVADETAGTFPVTTTGALTLVPHGEAYPSALILTGSLISGNLSLTGTAGGELYSGMRFNSLASVGSFTVGHYSGMTSSGTPVVLGNTSSVTLAAPLAVAGPLSVYGATLTVNNNLTVSTAGAPIYLVGTGAISVAANNVLQTNGGAITLEATSGGTATSSASAISLGAGSQLLSQGGDIWLGGGYAGTQGALYAATTVSSAGKGVNIGGTINAAGGDIAVYGRNLNNYGDGVYFSAASVTTTGSGTLKVYGDSHGGGNGTNVFGGVTFHDNSSTLSTVNGDLVVEGILTAVTNTNTPYGSGINFFRTGNGSGGTSVLNILSQTGNLDFVGDNANTNLAFGFSHLAKGDVYLGSPASGWVATGDVRFRITDYGYSTSLDPFVVNTTGAVTYEPINASFYRTFSMLATMDWAKNASALTVGKPGCSSSVGVYSGLNVSGPVRFYSGEFTVSGAFSVASTGPNSEIRIESTDIINLKSTSLTTEGGPIVVWANRDGQSTAYVDWTSSVTTNGGPVWVGGGSGSAIWNGIPVGSDLVQGSGLGLRFTGTLDTRLTNNSAVGGDVWIGVAASNAAYPELVNTSGLIKTIYAGNGDISVITSDGRFAVSGSTDAPVSLNTTGTLSIAPKSGTNWLTDWSFEATSNGNVLDGLGGLAGLRIVNPSTLGGLSLGTYTGTGLAGDDAFVAANTQNISISSDLNVGGAVTVYGGTLTLNGNLTSTNGAVSLYSDSPLAGLSSTSRSVNAGGLFRYAPQGASFTTAVTFPITNLSVTANGLTLGKLGNASDITLASALTVNGPVELYGYDLVVSAGLTAAGDVLFDGATLDANGNVKTTGVGSDVTLDVATASFAPGTYLWSSGGITNNGALTLEALNSASVSSYAQMKFGGTFTAGPSSSVQVQQYLEEGQHLLGVPFSGMTAAFFGGNNPGQGGVGTSGTGYAADNKNLWSWTGSDWTSVANNSAALSNGVGYVGTVGTNGFRNAAGVQTFVGVQPHASAEIPLTYAYADDAVIVANETANNGGLNLGRHGWNLVGNPFTCALEYNYTNRPNGVNAAVYKWVKAKNGNPARYTAHSPAGSGNTEYIAPLQAFWVQTTNNMGPSPKLSLAMGAHGTVAHMPEFNKTSDYEADRFRFEVVRTSRPTWKDESYIALAAGTTDGFDGDWDAYKLTSGAESMDLYSFGPNERMSLANNALEYSEDATAPKQVPFGFRSTGHGETFSLQLDATAADGDYDVFVEDLVTGKMHDLASGAYSFVHDSTVTERFVVHFRSAKARDYANMGGAEAPLNVWTRPGELVFWMNQPATGRWTLMGLDGKEIQFGKVVLDGTSVHTVPIDAALPHGVYLVRTRLANGSTVFVRVML